MEEGKRFNEGKLRYDLIHPIAQEGLVRVLTLGAKKYEPRNWEKGMSWSSILASLKRHLAAIEKGEDFDLETGEFHIDHVQCNAHFLSAYLKSGPNDENIEIQTGRDGLPRPSGLAVRAQGRRVAHLRPGRGRRQIMAQHGRPDHAV